MDRRERFAKHLYRYRRPVLCDSSLDISDDLLGQEESTLDQGGVSRIFVYTGWIRLDPRLPTLMSLAAAWATLALAMVLCFVIVNIVKKTTPAPVNNQVVSEGIATAAMIFITNSVYHFSWRPVSWPCTAESRSLPTGVVKFLQADAC